MSSSRIRLIMLSVLAVFAVSAFAASTASAKRVWTVCKEVAGSGTEPPVKFDNKECNTKAKPLAERKWEDVVLPVGQTRSLTVVKNTNAELKVPLAGETIVCKKLALNAGNTIENVLVEGKGPTGRDLVTNTFTECSNPGKPLCTPVTVLPFTTPTFLNENTAKTKIYDEFRPNGATELTPKQITEKGEAASKVIEEEQKTYVTISQGGQPGCTAPATTKAEGNGVVAEISPEGMSTKKKFIFPCPPIKEETLWNGLTVSLKLKAFGFAAQECINEVEVELTTKEGWDVQ